MLAALLTTVAVAGTIQLPQTGQTTSYATGDDGDQPRGAALPNPRFTNNNNGTITDNLTGLIWLRDANCFETFSGGGVLPASNFNSKRVGRVTPSAAGGLPLSWQDALAWSNALKNGDCGLSDGSQSGNWRLPNRKELMSLINLHESDGVSWLTSFGFFDVQYNYYWTSTTNASMTSSAWSVYLSDGSVYYDNKLISLSVWPVRGGE